jgi:deoxyribonuclease V
MALHHSWNLTPKQAILLQGKLASRVVRENRLGKIRRVAGADVAFSPDGKQVIAGIILLEFPSLKIIERVQARSPLQFPYIPGLLTFREGPALEEAWNKLSLPPDLIFFDGQGLAHPRRLGIASHMGLIWDVPSIGCAKSRLCGQGRAPGFSRGAWTRLKDKGEVIGAILRSRSGVKPLYVSIGHRVDLKTAVAWTLACHDGTRLPKPTREADRYVRELKRKF